MVAILSALFLLLGSQIDLAHGRLSPTLERRAGLDLASHNGTQLSGDVSSCPGSPLSKLELLNVVSARSFYRILLDFTAKHRARSHCTAATGRRGM